MTTPLIILAILTIPVFLTAFAGVATGRSELYRVGGIISLSIAFAFFAVGHFVLTDEMVDMLPAFVPQRRLIMYATGVLEIGLAAALLVPRYRQQAGAVCMAVLVLFFFSNIYAALHSVGPGGHHWGPVYLLIRGPLQLLLIGWTYWFIIRVPRAASD